MAEENTAAPAEAAANTTEEQQPSFQLVRCFLKDASLEMPHAPEIFFEEHEEQPEVKFQFGVAARQLPVEDGYEVILRATITVGFKDKTMFLVEGSQSGVFELKNLPQEALGQVTNVVCPSVILPYLRANLADMINRTGLPAVHLPEVNFELLMQQRMAEAQAAASKQGSAQA